MTVLTYNYRSKCTVTCSDVVQNHLLWHCWHSPTVSQYPILTVISMLTKCSKCQPIKGPHQIWCAVSVSRTIIRWSPWTTHRSYGTLIYEYRKSPRANEGVWVSHEDVWDSGASYTCVVIWDTFPYTRDNYCRYETFVVRSLMIPPIPQWKGDLLGIGNTLGWWIMLVVRIVAIAVDLLSDPS